MMSRTSITRVPQFRARRRSLLVFSFTILLFLPGCLFTFKTNPRIQNVAFRENPPETVAVLPFTNQSNAPETTELARSFFYNALASKSYTDIELSRVDAILAQLALEEGKNPLELSADFLAQKLGA